MKVGDLIKCPSGIALITSVDYINGGYVLAHFASGSGHVVVYCDDMEVISESR